METVLAATLIVFLLLFGAFTLSEVYIHTQDNLQGSWQEMAERLSAQMHTNLTVVSAQANSTGQLVEFVVRNDGAQRLVDYENWDVFIQYADESSGAYGIWRLPYTRSLATNQVPVLNQNAETLVASLAAGALTWETLAIADPDNPSTEQFFILDAVPASGTLLHAGEPLGIGQAFTQEDVNTGLIVYTHESDSTGDSFTFTVADAAIMGLATNQWGISAIYADWDTRRVETIEPGVWNPGEELALRLEIAPAVAPGTALEVKVVTSNGATAATALVSQEPHSAAITITPRVAMNNPAAVANGGSVVLSGAHLLATGVDVAPSDIVYSVISAPAHGTLSLGSTFTQANIDANQLSYSHDGSGQSDTFTFSVTDGMRTTGTYTFDITISG